MITNEWQNGINFNRSATNENHMEVTLHKPCDMIGNGQVRPATVNWCSFGSTDPDTAEMYALTILEAAAKARELNAALVAA